MISGTNRLFEGKQLKKPLDSISRLQSTACKKHLQGFPLALWR